MRIGVLSDTHLRTVPEGFIQGLRRAFSGVDRVLHCGDWVAPAVMDALEAEGWEVVGVAGNMDPPEIQCRFPATRELDLGGTRIGLIHGWGSPQGIEARVSNVFQEVGVVVFGHTHRPHWGKFRNMWLFNPGAACGWGNPQGRTVGLLDIGEMVHGSIVQLEGVGW